jgi:type IV pilus assembly protein PilM
VTDLPSITSWGTIMAATNGVWGIDIGQCALKALRCEYDEENRILVATAFDFIEYPKILSQPDAEPKELIQEALQQFLDRNDLKGDRVSLSVPGQNGLARFFQPPPVDMRKLPDIVRFEARQQIPFPLDEVIWDFQLMGGASEVEGFLMEAEVGLFAMKRDQVYEALEPFLEHELEVDIVQLAPLCAFNFVAHNLMTEEMEMDVYDPDNPPESFVILSVGTDTTDLVITNGFRVWQRNIPLGGNHFTKQLTKELKLTFAKAEHLKRNVREAEDAKAVIQAMRPVFNDLLTEVQRSIGFFQNIDRNADITGMIMLGNAVKLPGLQQYLSKNLAYELVDVDHASWAARLAGQTVLTSPQFKENMHAFGNCYGLCLQGLGRAKLDTNLLPKEILTERLIRAKKPWALATAAALMLAFSINFFFEYAQWYKVHPTMERDGVTWEAAMTEVENVQSELTNNEQKDQERVDKLKELTALGRELSGNSDRRLLWLELMKAINRALPQDENVAANEIPDPKELPISERKELHIEYVESEYFLDLAEWFEGPVREKYIEELDLIERDNPSAPSTSDPNATATDAEGTATDSAVGPPDPVAGAPDQAAEGGVQAPSGPGWVIELKGYHYFNDEKNMRIWAGVHVRNTLLKNLREQTIELPTGPGQSLEKFTMEELGIGYAILAYEPRIEKRHPIPNPFYEGLKKGTGSDNVGQFGQFGQFGNLEGTPTAEPTGNGSAPTAETSDTADDADEANGEPKEDADEPPVYIVPRFDFIVQFCWQEQMLSDRLKKRAEELEQESIGTETSTEADNSGAAPPTGG